MTKHWTVGVVVAVAGGLMTACPAPKHDDDSGGLIEAGSEEGGATEESGSESSDGALEGDGSSTGVSFILKPDSGIGFDCDVFAQDCAEGEKCMPWANDGGGAWNATRCSPVADNPAQVGEACEVEGNGVSGLDNCDFGAMCFYVDPDTLQGACVALCEGTADDPMCIDNGVCTISGSGSLAVCLPSCNPLEDECPDNQTCTPTVSANGFTCTPLAPDPAAPGEACEFFSQCQSGSTCLSGDLIGCDAPGGCCTSFCDLALGQPNPDCPDPEHECLPWYERGEAPPGLDDVGVCGVP